jgi:ribosomal protein S2
MLIINKKIKIKISRQKRLMKMIKINRTSSIKKDYQVLQNNNKKNLEKLLKGLKQLDKMSKKKIVPH